MKEEIKRERELTALRGWLKGLKDVKKVNGIAVADIKNINNFEWIKWFLIYIFSSFYDKIFPLAA